MAKKLKVGIIGTGMIGTGCHIPGYRSIPDECEIVWACDIKPDVLKKVAKEHSIPKTTTDYKEVLADKEIDAVSVAVPNISHCKLTVDALAAGKNVLCEKPLSMNAAESKLMCQAAKKSGKILQVALQMRFSGSARFMREYIANGHMGDIYYARAQALRRRGVPHWGVFIDKQQQGGGPLIDIGVHILDYTLHLMGYPKPVSVSAKTWNMLGTNPDLYNYWGTYDHKKFTVEDMAVGLVKFDNGAVVVLESSFMANLEKEIFTTQFFGTKAGAIVKGFGEDSITIFTERDQQLFDMSPRNVPEVASQHTAEIQAFVKAVANGDSSPVPPEHGMMLNAIFDGMYASSESGKEQSIDVSF